ncbi:MAG: beta-lactamase family protein [Candidatus Latescibacteria bacterium]|nr:beta-lactamase family protein [Candidatus Latescibacterota bacterium]
MAGPSASKIDAIFTEWDKPDSPGCTLAVVRDGEIIYKRGYGMADLEHNIPITTKSIFYLGSVSKQFVAACIALLEEQGKLSFADNIRKFVPEIPDYGDPITIRHLIYHTSGLRDYLELWTYAGRNYMDSMLENEVLALISRQKELNFPTGEQYMYCNSGYFLLALIVKRASGQSLRDYAETYIFKPLGMSSTHFHDDNTMIVKNRADGHFTDDDGSFGLLTQRFALVGSGGLYSNVEDLYLWDQNFYLNKIGARRQKLIDTILTCGKLNNGEKLVYAFGNIVGEYRGLRTVSHGGALGGYRTHLLRFPEQNFSVIILCNLGDMQPGDLAEKVADFYLSGEMKPAETAIKNGGRKENTDSDGGDHAEIIDDIHEYPGEYYSDELRVTYTIYIEDDHPFVSIGYNPGINLETVEKNTFKGDGISLLFDRNRNDEITGFTMNAGRVKNLKFIKKL